MAVVEIREQFQHLMGLYVPIGVGVFVIVVGLMAFVVVRFRARPGRVPSQRSDAPRLELLYVAVIAAVVVLLLAATYSTESSVDAIAATPALRINAIASDWRWRFDYPQQGISEIGQGEAPTDLYVPAGQTVEFDLSSLDVLHAFAASRRHARAVRGRHRRLHVGARSCRACQGHLPVPTAVAFRSSLSYRLHQKRTRMRVEAPRQIGVNGGPVA